MTEEGFTGGAGRTLLKIVVVMAVFISNTKAAIITVVMVGVHYILLP